jgi:hypothetical protein
MRFTVEISNVRELVMAAGVTMGTLAKRMGRSESMTSLKVKGVRPMFLDEIGAIVGAINDAGLMTVTDAQVLKLIGKENVKVRGFAG